MTIVHEMFHWCRNEFIFPLLPFGDWAMLVNFSMLQALWKHDLSHTRDPLCIMDPAPGECIRPNGDYLGDWQWGNGANGDGTGYDIPIQKPFIGDTMGYYNKFIGLSSQAPGPLDDTYNNPTRLVWNFDEGDGDEDALYQMMGNLDNFTCWIWSRWLDHGYCRLNSDAHLDLSNGDASLGVGHPRKPSSRAVGVI